MSKETQTDLALDIEKIESSKYNIDLPSLPSYSPEYNDDSGHFTYRSAIVGSLIGIIVVASNMYLGLKAGNTFSAAMFGAILGYVVMKPLSKVLPTFLGGGPFTAQENASLQSAATAVGSLSAGFQSGIPAMYHLELLPKVDDAWGVLILWTTAAAFHGMFFGIPLRKYFVIQQKLVFPTPTAAAESIKTLHSDMNAEQSAFQQGKWIFGGFVVMFLWKILAFFVPFLFDYHILYWIGSAAGHSGLIDADVKWGWRLQSTGAFIGGGMLVGLNTALSFLAGEIFAFGIAGPALFYNTDIVTHSKVYGFSSDGKPTTQYWFIWPGVTIIIVATFTELLMNYKTLYNAFKGIYCNFINLLATKFPSKFEVKVFNDVNETDPVPSHLQISPMIWIPGLTLTSALTVLVLHFVFLVPIGGCFLALLLGFILAFIGTQSAGDIDINPMGSIGKVSQFVFAGLPYPNLHIALSSNLLAGIASMSCAAQTVDMVSDLKTGHLLKASPRSQFKAQFFGSFVGIFAAVVMFWVFAKAYPCALNKAELDHCQFKVPSGVAWASVATALNTKDNAIPQSSAIACLIFGIVTFVIVVLRRTYLKEYRNYLPNMNAFGMAFVTTTPYVAIANAIGAIIVEIWKRVSPSNADIGTIGLASGMLAGEGIGGVVHAIFIVAGINQVAVSTGFACPDNDATSCSD